MRLLIITQKVDTNDDNLGFFHHWLEKFAQNLDSLYVLCLGQGEYDLPKNVVVYSMGKEKGISKTRQFFRLQQYLFKNLRYVDGVFVHMNPIYVIAGFPLTKIFGKKVVLWYTHKSRNLKLRFAEKLVHKVVTASRESFRIKSKKVEILGHGIDTEIFQPIEREYKTSEDNIFKILTAGRIVPSKNLEIQIRALDFLVNKKNIKNIRMTILGSGSVEELRKLIAVVKEKMLQDHIIFGGSVANSKMPNYYNDADVFINSSRTGSLDKAVLEAMACGVPSISSNEAFAPIFFPIDRNLYFKKQDAESLSRSIEYIRSLNGDERWRVGMRLREIVLKNHNVNNLIRNIILQFSI